MPYDKGGRPLNSLRHVSDPTQESHAVNLRTLLAELEKLKVDVTTDLEKSVKELIQISVDKKLRDINFNGYVLHNIGAPKRTVDAASVGYVLSNALCFKNAGYDAGDKKLYRVADPVNPKDAVNLRSLKVAINELKNANGLK